MMNQSNNFGFLRIQDPISSVSSLQYFPLMNYQQFPLFSCFWMDQNFCLQPYRTYQNYGLQSIIGTQMIISDQNLPSIYSATEESDVIQTKNPIDQLHFYSHSNKFDKKNQQIGTKLNGAFTYCNSNQENSKLSSQIDVVLVPSPSKIKTNCNNEILEDDKRIIQNLRYQRKNIEANIVNKIYTYLKMILKIGQNSVQNLIQDKEKSITYFKVLQKLQKAKKQIIKRQFLKALIQMDDSLPGYTKVTKQLQKKGQSIQQFEYYIRVIIKYYLKTQAPNSILTSKKMNPSLWIDHLKKVRQIQEYLFTCSVKENSN